MESHAVVGVEGVSQQICRQTTGRNHLLVWVWQMLNAKGGVRRYALHSAYHKTATDNWEELWLVEIRLTKSFWIQNIKRAVYKLVAGYITAITITIIEIKIEVGRRVASHCAVTTWPLIKPQCLLLTESGDIWALGIPGDHGDVGGHQHHHHHHHEVTETMMMKMVHQKPWWWWWFTITVITSYTAANINWRHLGSRNQLLG